MSSKRICSVSSGELVIRDVRTGAVVWQGKPDGYPVREALSLPGDPGCAVLLDRMSVGGHSFENLIRCDPTGQVIWRAELPEPSKADAYVAMRLEGSRVLANTWSGWLVELDLDTGRIRAATFTK